MERSSKHIRSWLNHHPSTYNHGYVIEPPLPPPGFGTPIGVPQQHHSHTVLIIPEKNLNFDAMQHHPWECLIVLAQ
eukprot:2769155-Prorocentrum_lima.AAC.1